jgi:beta-galactosidase
VILTGSQLPIGVLRTDGKENLMDGQPYLTAEGALVMEVNALIPHITGTRTQYDDKVNVLRIETE